VDTRRRLIVNADDFGLSGGVNRGIAKAHDHGIVTSASLMVHMPAAVEAAALAHNRPLLGLGLHIDIGEWKYERDDWVPTYERVSRDDPKAVKAIVLEQLERFRRLTGAEPTHLDSHQHAHKRDPLRSITCQLADELGVPLRHFTPQVSYCGEYYGQDAGGKSLPERLTSSFLIGIIKSLDRPVTELSCHPAAQVDFESPYSAERLCELDALCLPAVVRAIDQCGLLLTSFRTLGWHTRKN
jgi:predicted glycoside hydrolase/deacetylase ChbG (UPF0249 family)